jgi:hypothetical protein
MQVKGLIVEELNEQGELKSFVLNNDYGIGDLWIAFPDEYDNPRTGPFHFLDDSYEKLFSTVYKDKNMRKVGSKRLKEIGYRQFEFYTNWDNIPVQASYELYYYSLYLPKFAYPINVDFELSIKNQWDDRLIKFVKDKERYIIYIACKGSDDQFNKRPQDLKLTVHYEINKNLFENKQVEDTEQYWKDKSPISNREFVKDGHLLKGVQYDKLENLIELINSGHRFNSQKIKLGEIPSKAKKILFVLANPIESTRLRLDEEYREIENGLRLSNGRDNFELKITTATRPNDLRREMLRYEPTFVHFSGHGDKDGIVLENEIGEVQLVNTRALAELFSLFEGKTECVLLNSCYSEEQAKAISINIPFVIGMNKSIPDNTAIQFAVGFYDAIGAGRNIEEAFKFGKNAINLNSITGQEIPQLIKK